MDENSKRIKEHCAAHGMACVYENGYITLLKGNWKIRLEKVFNIPLTFGGKAEFNIQNVMAASLACYMQGFKIEDIRQALLTFVPSPAQTPGRMNLFKFKEFNVMVDYAHNAHGMRAIGKFLDKVEAKRKIGVIAGVGDRRDSDIVEIGVEAGKIFDEIVIRQDRNMRGRNERNHRPHDQRY